MQLRWSDSDRFRLHTRERRKQPIQKPTQDQIDLYQREGRDLARLMKDADFDWMLEWGHVTPLHLWKYYRQHADFDIGIFHDDLGRFALYIQKRGYKLFWRNYTVKQVEDLPFDVWTNAPLQEVRSCRLKRLYALPVDQKWSIQLSQWFELDIHIHTRGDSEVINGNDHRLPIAWFWTTSIKILDEDVPVWDPRLCYYHKLWWRRPRHIHDRVVIETEWILSAESIEEVAQIRRENDAQKKSPNGWLVISNS